MNQDEINRLFRDAIINQDYIGMKMYLDMGISADVLNNMLNYAAVYGYRDVIDFLLENGANPELSHPPLLFTVLDDGDNSLLVYLLEKKGLNLNVKNNKGITFAQQAKRRGLEYLIDSVIEHRLQKQRKQKQQIQKTKRGKQAVVGQLSAIPRIQTLSGGRYLYPGGSSYLQAGKQFAQIGRSRGMNVTGVEEEFKYPQGYQQFWRQYLYKPPQLTNGQSGNGSYNLRSPVKKVKKSVKKYKKSVKKSRK